MMFCWCNARTRAFCFTNSTSSLFTCIPGSSKNYEVNSFGSFGAATVGWSSGWWNKLDKPLCASVFWESHSDSAARDYIGADCCLEMRRWREFWCAPLNLPVARERRCLCFGGGRTRLWNKKRRQRVQHHCPLIVGPGQLTFSMNWKPTCESFIINGSMRGRTVERRAPRKTNRRDISSLFIHFWAYTHSTLSSLCLATY